MTTSGFLSRIQRYCALSERCTQDVVKKLQSWDVSDNEIEETLADLRGESYLDDQRFARSYVSDKWKLNHWGRIKIRFALIAKEIPESFIDQALAEIDDQTYAEILSDLLIRKHAELNHLDSSQQLARLIQFAHQRGFEEDLVWEWARKHKV